MSQEKPRKYKMRELTVNEYFEKGGIKVSMEAGNVWRKPKGAKSVKDPSQVPKGWSIVKGPRGGVYAVPPAKGAKPKKHPYKVPPRWGGRGSVPSQDAAIQKVIDMMADTTKDAEDIYREVEKRYGKDSADSVRDDISKAVGQSLPDEEPKEPLEGRAIVNTPAELDQWAKEGGWKSGKDFLEDAGATFEEIQDKQFEVVNGRLFIEDELEEPKTVEDIVNHIAEYSGDLITHGMLPGDEKYDELGEDIKQLIASSEHEPKDVLKGLLSYIDKMGEEEGWESDEVDYWKKLLGSREEPEEPKPKPKLYDKSAKGAWAKDNGYDANDLLQGTERNAIDSANKILSNKGYEGFLEEDLIKEIKNDIWENSEYLPDPDYSTSDEEFEEELTRLAKLGIAKYKEEEPEGPIPNFPHPDDLNFTPEEGEKIKDIIRANKGADPEEYIDFAGNEIGKRVDVEDIELFKSEMEEEQSSDIQNNVRSSKIEHVLLMLGMKSTGDKEKDIQNAVDKIKNSSEKKIKSYKQYMGWP